MLTQIKRRPQTAQTWDLIRDCFLQTFVLKRRYWLLGRVLSSCQESVLGPGEKRRHGGQIQPAPHLLAEWSGANYLTSLRISGFSSVNPPAVVSVSCGSVRIQWNNACLGSFWAWDGEWKQPSKSSQALPVRPGLSTHILINIPENMSPKQDSRPLGKSWRVS